jgi:hypothetical protein
LLQAANDRAATDTSVMVLRFIIVSICSHIAARSTRASRGPFRASNKLRTDRKARSF